MTYLEIHADNNKLVSNSAARVVSIHWPLHT